MAQFCTIKNNADSTTYSNWYDPDISLQIGFSRDKNYIYDISRGVVGNNFCLYGNFFIYVLNIYKKYGNKVVFQFLLSDSEYSLFFYASDMAIDLLHQKITTPIFFDNFVNNFYKYYKNSIAFNLPNNSLKIVDTSSKQDVVYQDDITVTDTNTGQTWILGSSSQNQITTNGNNFSTVFDGIVNNIITPVTVPANTVVNSMATLLKCYNLFYGNQPPGNINPYRNEPPYNPAPPDSSDDISTDSGESNYVFLGKDVSKGLYRSKIDFLEIGLNGVPSGGSNLQIQVLFKESLTVFFEGSNTFTLQMRIMYIVLVAGYDNSGYLNGEPIDPNTTTIYTTNPIIMTMSQTALNTWSFGMTLEELALYCTIPQDFSGGNIANGNFYATIIGLQIDQTDINIGLSNTSTTSSATLTAGITVEGTLPVKFTIGYTASYETLPFENIYAANMFDVINAFLNYVNGGETDFLNQINWVQNNGGSGQTIMPKNAGEPLPTSLELYLTQMPNSLAVLSENAMPSSISFKYAMQWVNQFFLLLGYSSYLENNGDGTYNFFVVNNDDYYDMIKSNNVTIVDCVISSSKLSEVAAKTAVLGFQKNSGQGVYGNPMYDIHNVNRYSVEGVLNSGNDVNYGETTMSTSGQKLKQICEQYYAQTTSVDSAGNPLQNSNSSPTTDTYTTFIIQAPNLVASNPTNTGQGVVYPTELQSNVAYNPYYDCIISMKLAIQNLINNVVGVQKIINSTLFCGQEEDANMLVYTSSDNLVIGIQNMVNNAIEYFTNIGTGSDAYFVPIEFTFDGKISNADIKKIIQNPHKYSFNFEGNYYLLYNINIDILTNKISGTALLLK